MRKEREDSATQKKELSNKVAELKLINNNIDKELKRLGLKKQVADAWMPRSTSFRKSASHAN